MPMPEVRTINEAIKVIELLWNKVEALEKGVK